MSIRSGKYLPFIIPFMIFASAAEAAELYGPEAGVVPYGMGRAYSAVADDWLALHYNPAGLALVEKVDVQLFDLAMGTNRDVLRNLSNLGNLGRDANNSIANTLNQYAGMKIGANLSNHTQITLPNLAAGVSYESNLLFNLENTANPQTLVRYTRDLSINLAGAVAAGRSKSLRLGARVRLMRRTGGVRNITVNEIAGSRDAILDRFNQAGNGFGGDLGMQYRLPTGGRQEVTLSYVWHDIGKTSFGSYSNARRPTRIEDNMVAGFAVRLPIGGRQNRRLERRYGMKRSQNHLTFAFDYSHMGYGLGSVDFFRHAHFGVNLEVPILSLQVGWNQSSLTLGTGFDIGLVRVALATYGEDLGSYAGQKTDRRYLLSIGSSLGFSGLK